MSSKNKKNKNKEMVTNYILEFKSFISRGNVVDMAVGVIVGTAFSKIITSLVNDILMHLIVFILGGLKFNSLTFTVLGVKVAYGSFIQTIVDFLIISFCIFMVIKLFERFKKKEKPAEVAKSAEVLLLEEIRDLLKNNS